jgi:2C-methyl-D-erythritol 2,4-cyclodiphosphate synthase
MQLWLQTNTLISYIFLKKQVSTLIITSEQLTETHSQKISKNVLQSNANNHRQITLTSQEPDTLGEMGLKKHIQLKVA